MFLTPQHIQHPRRAAPATDPALHFAPQDTQQQQKQLPRRPHAAGGADTSSPANESPDEARSQPSDTLEKPDTTVVCEWRTAETKLLR